MKSLFGANRVGRGVWYRVGGAIAVAYAAFATAGGCSSNSSSPETQGAGGSDSSASMHVSSTASTQAPASTGSFGPTTGTQVTTTGTTTTSSSSGGGGEGGSSSSSGGGGAGGGGGCAPPPIGSAHYPSEIEPNNTQMTANDLPASVKGAVGQLCVIGDVDIYKITVAAGAALTASITTDGTGCPAPGKMQLRLLDHNFAAVLTDMHATGMCPAFLPSHYPQVQSLPAGTYYLEVRNLSNGPIQAYQLDYSTAMPSCGDGVASPDNGEQCDDGNLVDGDGCSKSCVIESASYINETEPDGTTATAVSVDGYAGGVGAINPAGDLDVYSITVTVPGSSIVARLSDGFGKCPNLGWHPELQLTSPAGDLLVTDKTSDTNGCPLIAPSTSAAATNLPMGVYTVTVRDAQGTGVGHLYVVDIKALAPGCGDTVIQPGEQCDDGNTIAGDGCSPTCQFENIYTPEIEPNDQVAQATPIGTANGWSASISSSLDKDAFSFVVTEAGDSVTITVDDASGGCPTNLDARVRLFDPMGNTIADIHNANPGSGPCAQITPANSAGAGNLAVGTYVVYVEQQGTHVVPKYFVTVKLSPPSCGDFVIQPGEQCDDGNHVSGDGCSATCQGEPPYEIEPNPSRSTATPLWPGTKGWIASISPIGDVDVFVFDLVHAGPVTIQTHAVGATTCGFDTEIGIFDAAGTRIAVDDDGGNGLCSKIDPADYPAVAHLVPGTYYIAVTEHSNMKVIPKYQIDLTLPP